MKDEQHLTVLTLADLLPHIQQCRGKNFRLVQMHATTLPDGNIEINYSLVQETVLDTSRLIIATSDVLPSISTYYPAAAFYENEIHDLFGVSFTDISIDYAGNFYRMSRQKPFAPATVKQPEGQED
jgi:ech hydrogenase subunit D